MFKAPTLPPAKKKSCNKLTFGLALERYENEDLDVLGDVGESKRKTFSKKFFFLLPIYCTVSMSLLVYK